MNLALGRTSQIGRESQSQPSTKVTTISKTIVIKSDGFTNITNHWFGLVLLGSQKNDLAFENLSRSYPQNSGSTSDFTIVYPEAVNNIKSG